MIAPGLRLLPMFILVAASLGTAALIESCVEAFGIDGDPIYLGRVGLLGVLALACAGIVATFVAQSCTHCEPGRYRAYLQRDVLDRLPFSGRGFRFTAIVAVLQALCMASIQIGDTPNPNENVIGWATSFLLVLTGTVVVRLFVASDAAPGARNRGSVRSRMQTSAGGARCFCRAISVNRWV